MILWHAFYNSIQVLWEVSNRESIRWKPPLSGNLKTHTCTVQSKMCSPRSTLYLFHVFCKTTPAALSWLCRKPLNTSLFASQISWIWYCTVCNQELWFHRRSEIAPALAYTHEIGKKELLLVSYSFQLRFVEVYHDSTQFHRAVHELDANHHRIELH
jgi:hypothetical protein